MDLMLELKKMIVTEKSDRIVSLDLIRGYFLFVILIDHLGRFFGFWEIFTGRGAQWVSAAEGFFFVSGIMIGLVRGRKMLGRPIRDIVEKCWSRAIVLYFWAVGLSLFFSFIAIWLEGTAGLKAGIYQGGDNLSLVKDTLSLYFSYGWADFLRYYAAYLFLSPLAIWMVRKRLWWLLLVISSVVWISTESMMTSWQILFFSGMVFGYYYEEIESSFKNLRIRTQDYIKRLIFGLTLISLSLSVYFTTFAEEYGKEAGARFLSLDLNQARNYSIETLRTVFDKTSLSPARLALFYLWFAGLFLLVKKYEGFFKDKVGWLLMTLGQNSLYVYIVHSIILFFLNLILPGRVFWIFNDILGAGFVGLIWFMAKRRFLFKIIPR